MNTSSATQLEALRELIRAFVAERDWERFHTPKNLAMALSVESAELLELFQWLPDNATLPPEKLTAARHEIADVLVYLLRLADVLGIEPYAAVCEKMAINRDKYPAERVRGDARKYDEYEAYQAAKQHSQKD